MFADIAYAAFEAAYLPSEAGAGAKNLMFAKAFLWGRWFALAGGLVYVAVTGNFRALRRGRAAAPSAVPPVGPAAPAEVSSGAPSRRRGWVAAVFLFGQGCGSLAVILNQYAIKLGNVVTVSALGGIQFFFVIAISAALTRFLPQLHSEPGLRRDLLLKALWSCVLFGGILVLVI